MSSAKGSGPGRRRRLRASPPGRANEATGAVPPARAGAATTASAASAPATAAATGTGPADAGPDRFERAVRVLAVTTGVLAWMSAGFVVLYAMALDPREGMSSGASIFKAADLIGWVVIGAAVLRDANAMRRRAFYLGLAAWAWVFALTWLVGQTAYLAAGEGVGI